MRQDGVGRVKKIFRYERLLYFMVAIFIPLSFFSGCATGEKGHYQHFQFDRISDSPEIDILDFRYGDCNHGGICADRQTVAKGDTAHSENRLGNYARGKTLYVKWRVRDTGKVYEDTVDLDKRMPKDINFHMIKIVVRYDQLFVYLVHPWDAWPAISLRKPILERHSKWIRKFLIYPDHPTTYPERIIE